MKSIMQEAATILKAIDSAWHEAGKPTEFNVKIYEEPQTNFLGMKVKSAKIGFFFHDAFVQKEKEAPAKKTKAARKQKERSVETKKMEAVKEKEQLKNARETTPGKRVMWSDDMIKAAKAWIDDSLKAMNKEAVPYTVDVNNYYLRFTFEKPLLDTADKERKLFRSFSFLMLQAIKKQFKRPLRGFKIVLTRAS